MKFDRLCTALATFSHGLLTSLPSLNASGMAGAIE